jgi:hypothetical protein
VGVRARVFLSCGQRHGSDEPIIADQVKTLLEDRGFSCYVAVRQQSLVGLRENIFEQLRSSEYFLFIDFRREGLLAPQRYLGIIPKQLAKDGLALHRGSLFSHQELAIASFLEIEVLGLRERGVNTLDGLVGHIQGNFQEFADRSKIPGLVEQLIEERNWRSDWQNALQIELPGEPYADMLRQPENARARFFHACVRNLHKDLVATDCYVYMKRLVRLDTGASIPLETVEFKWAGYVLPNAPIAPRSARKFDAVWFFHERPAEPLFNLFTDSGRYVPRIPGVGDYEMCFEVRSENLPAVERTFILRVGDSLDAIHLEPLTD